MKEIQHALVEIWREVLGVEHVDIFDDFFDLGGSSLMAVPLFDKIEQAFGKKLPLATLYEAPTLEELAGVLSEEEWEAPWASLVEIERQGSKPPLFLMHGAGGNVLLYRDLARHLGPDQPVYGLQAQGLDGRKPFHTRVEDMAEQYIGDIQTIWPDGPYLLGGYCMGGTVALEMAQQLQARGKKVALLALFESYNWSKLSPKTSYESVYQLAEKLEFHVRNFLLLDRRQKWKFILEKARVAKQRRPVWYGMAMSRLGLGAHQISGQNVALASLWKSNDKAALDYIPKAYPGRITQFSPIRTYTRWGRPELGWEALAARGVEVHKLPVYPAGMLVDPFARLLAEELRACIDHAINPEMARG
jgi:thioesterase domain-containing protein/acyl carrier protein